MFSFIIVALKIIILLGFLIFIHELGHFTVAKLCKVKVNEFSIGFGPILFSKQGKVTKYQLRLIPLGGFVNMEGEDQRSENEGAFNKVAIPKRIAIVAAGGLVNILFAVVVYFGLQTYKADNVSTKISDLTPGYAAESVGLLPGDEIVKINNTKTRRQSDIYKAVEDSKGNEITVFVKRNNQIVKYNIVPTTIKYRAAGLYLNSETNTTIEGFDSSTGIEEQGFKIGDKLISIDGINVEDNLSKVSQALEANIENEKINFIVRRNGENIPIEAATVIEQKYLLGVVLEKAENNLFTNMYYAFYDTRDFAFSILDNIKMLFSGKVKTNDLMGPVGISTVVAKTNGIQQFIYILTLISLSLGVTNLLPFPPLDGGKIVLLIVEGIRKKPLQEKCEVGIQMIGFGLMILLSIYVTFNDISRII